MTKEKEWVPESAPLARALLWSTWDFEICEYRPPMLLEEALEAIQEHLTQARGKKVYRVRNVRTGHALAFYER